MAQSSGIIGKNTKLSYLDGSGYVDIAELFNLTDVKPSVDEVEFTHYESPDGYKEFKPSWIDASTVEADANYLDSVTETLFAMVGVVHSWKITKGNGATWTFDGFIKQMEGTNENQGKCSTKLTIRCTSKPNYTPVA